MKKLQIQLHGLKFDILVKYELFRTSQVNRHVLTVIQIDRVQTRYGDVFLKHDTDIIAKASIQQEINLKCELIKRQFESHEIDFINPIVESIEVPEE